MLGIRKNTLDLCSILAMWPAAVLRAAFAVGLFLTIAACVPRAAADDAGNGFEYCYTNFPGATGYVANQPTYFTAVFGFHGGSAWGEMFGRYVEKKYSLRTAGPAGCSYSGQRPVVETSLKQRTGQLKAAGHPVVETDWTKDKHEALMAELKASPPPPPPAAAAPKTPAPPSAAQAEYEKAMAAQKPRANTAASMDAAGTPVSTPSEKYTYCVTMGSPRANNSARTSYYFTAIFLASPTVHPQRAFYVMLQAAHPQEQITGVSCMTAQPMDTTQTVMTHDVAGKRAKYNVVETNWKP